jgi:hypothetical protein
MIAADALAASLAAHRTSHCFEARTLHFKREMRDLRAQECVVLLAGIEIPVRYEILRAGEVIVLAVKINGFWLDPAGRFTESTIKVWENVCLADSKERDE